MKVLLLLFLIFAQCVSSLKINVNDDSTIEIDENVRNLFAGSHLPGFSTSFTQNGINYFTSVGVSVLQKVIQSTSIPNSDGEVKSPLGKLHYWLSNAQLSNTQFSGVSVKLVAGQGLAVQINGFQTTCNTNWHYRRNKWPHVSGTGTATIHVGGTIQLLVSFSAVNEHLQANVLSCNVNLQQFDIHVSGKGSGFYNFILKLVHKPVRNAVNRMLNDAISQNTANGLNKVLTNFLILQRINDKVVFDIGMVQNPVFEANRLSLYESGEAYNSQKMEECPQQFCPQISLPHPDSNRMVQMLMSDYVTNSFAYVFYNNDMFEMIFTSKDLPKDSVLKLNTDYFANTIPELTSAYPHCDMKLKAYATAVPSTSFTTKGAVINAVGNVEVYVNANGTEKLAFVISGNLLASGNASMNGVFVKPLVTYIKSSWTLKSSNIGNINLSTLNSVLDFFGQFMIIPIINQRIQNGIQLPSLNGLSFVNPSLQFSDHIFVVTTDVNYAPPSYLYQ